MERYYFDHNATTPVSAPVLEAMTAALRDDYGNASSIHHYGQAAKQRLEAARRAVAAKVNAQPEEIVFTSGGTEANNLALFGSLAAGDHFVTTAMEHPAVLHPAAELERRGVAVTVVAVDASGVVAIDALRAALRPETKLISVMAVNNELGTIQPVAEIARECGIRLHVDAVQALGKVNVDVRAWGVDLASFSAHKIYGPKGIGALFVRKGTLLRKTTFGGRHERDRRPGTENVPAAVGFGVACETLSDPGPLGRLRDRLEQGLRAAIPGARVNGAGPRVSNTSNVLIPGVEGEAMVIGLDLKGFAVSSGAACSSGAVEPSHVLTAIGLSREDARSSLRFSLGQSNTEEQVDALIQAAADVAARLRKLSPTYA